MSSSVHVLLMVPVLALWPPATNKCDLEDGIGDETDSENALDTTAHPVRGGRAEAEAHDVVTVAAEETRQAGLTVACSLSLDSQNSRIHLGCLTHNSRIHSFHVASHARAHSSVVSVTGDC